MSRFVNESGGTLVLADRREILNGQEVEITGDGLKNQAFVQWIDEGKLVEKKSAKKSDDK
ncbi:MAG: hypothetical protein CML61_10135 [Rhodobacteraceae bacterium]|nr:hypothetical protein [Paracoccaceae bacterium]|tara:strand:- start:1343 stop:1522 length:180 start_codon:yes stop_codon:yes gene_type:complete